MDRLNSAVSKNYINIHKCFCKQNLRIKFLNTIIITFRSTKLCYLTTSKAKAMSCMSDPCPSTGYTSRRGTLCSSSSRISSTKPLGMFAMLEEKGSTTETVTLKQDDELWCGLQVT